MSEFVRVIEIQDWKRFTITRITLNGTVLSTEQFTAETWPMVRIEKEGVRRAFHHASYLLARECYQVKEGRNE